MLEEAIIGIEAIIVTVETQTVEINEMVVGTTIPAKEVEVTKGVKEIRTKFGVQHAKMERGDKESPTQRIRHCDACTVI